MKDKSILMIVIVMVAALAAIAAICYVLLLEEPTISTIPTEVEKEIVPPPATGNIDDVADALIKETADESSLLLEEENDVRLITTDSQEIGDFGQSINENEL